MAFALTSDAEDLWQLTFTYGDQGLRLVAADPVPPVAKQTILASGDSAPLALGFSLEWLDDSGNVIQTEPIQIPLGARSAFPANGDLMGHEEFIPPDGAFTIRVPGPSSTNAAARLRIIKQPTSDGTVSIHSASSPQAFNPSSQEYLLPKVNNKIALKNPAQPNSQKSSKGPGFNILGGPTAVRKVHDSGPDSNRLVIVVLGDGFTEADLTAGKFTDQVNRFFEHFFNTSPWNVLSNGVNVYQIDVVSNESGADYEDASPANGGTLKDTYFDTKFWAGGVERCLYLGGTGIARATAAADSFVGPGVWDNILIFVNSDKYGGCGGAVGVSSLNPSADEIQIHEFGHSFARLADEYEYGSTGTSCVDSPLPNVDCAFNLANLKWAPWIDPGTPLPTPENSAYSGIVGAFEGGLYQTTGVVRPMLDCRMRTLGKEFCPICKEAHVLKLLEKLDLVGGALPTESTVELTTNSIGSFSVEPLDIPGIEYQWYLDAISIPGETNPVIHLSGNGIEPHQGLLELVATFSTPLVRAQVIQSHCSWNVNFTGVPTILVGSAAIWEGDTGTNEIQIPVNLSSPSGTSITVHYETVDGTALASNDYESQAGDLTFVPGETSSVLPIKINGDLTPEPDEAFSVRFSIAAGAQLPTNSISVVILDDDNSPQVAITTPASGAQFSEGDPIEITVSPVSGRIAMIELFADNEPLITGTNSTLVTTWTKASTGFHNLFASATSVSGVQSAVATAQINVVPRSDGVRLIPIDASWLYDASTNDYGTAWRDESYDDSAWVSSGHAVFFSSIFPVAGPKGTPIPITVDGVRLRSFYFRNHFSFQGDANTLLTLTASNVVDDGAVFYLNGTEVGRLRMPSGPISRGDFALDGGWATNYEVISFDTAALKHGDNVMAVELHLSSDTSFPATFGMSLTAEVGINPVLVRYATEGAKWSISELAQSLTGSADFALSRIDPISVGGGALSTNENWIFYAAPQDLTASDSFRFTLIDSAGSSIAGIATINTLAKPESAGNLKVVSSIGGALQIVGDGIPNFAYAIEFRESPDSGLWQRLGEATADANGVVSVVDTPAPGTPRFYRAVPK